MEQFEEMAANPNEYEFICPYCGKVYDGAWEYFPDINNAAFTMQCEECDRRFKVMQTVLTTYTSEPVKK